MLNAMAHDARTFHVYRVVRGDGQPVPSYTGEHDFPSAVKTLKDRGRHGSHQPYRIERREVSLSEWVEVTPDAPELRVAKKAQAE